MATLCVLAAGLGSRYGGFKQIDHVSKDGAWLLDYAIFDALRAGFSTFVLVINEEVREKITQHVNDRWRSACTIHYVTQEKPQPPRTKPWGTAHATYSAHTHINEPFALINADDFYGPEAYQALYRFLEKNTLRDAKKWAMAGYKLGDTLSKSGSVSRGICQVDEQGYLKHISEASGLIRDQEYIIDETRTCFSPSSVVSMNCWAFSPALFAFLEKTWQTFYEKYKHDTRAECYLPHIVAQMQQKHLASVEVLPAGKQWMGMTYAADRSYLTSQLQHLHTSGLYPHILNTTTLKQGETLKNP